VVEPRDDLLTIGSAYGGWTVPGSLLGSDSVCLGGGVGRDITFDLGLIERFGCGIEEFDPTPGAAKYIAPFTEKEPRLRYEQVAVWSRDESIRLYDPDYGDENFSAINLHETSQFIEVEARTVATLMKERGLAHLDLLKLDIEGAEFEVIDSICRDGLDIATLCIEFHRKGSLKPLTRSLKLLRSHGYLPVHMDGYDVTFVHR
jgi:FkbM family methyltransferase